MVRRHVLAAISKGIAAGDDAVARAAIGRIDWVLRGRARRLLTSALIDATLAARVSDSEDPRHWLRAAALVVRRQTGIDLADREAVERAYEASSPPEVPRLPVASILAAALVLTLTTAVTIAAVVVTVPPAPGGFTRPPAPPPVGAYRDGGVPGRDAGIEHVLATSLASSSFAPSPALAPWPEVARTWRDLGDELARYQPDDDRLDADLRERVHALSDQLAATGLGYFVDVELAPRVAPVLTAYRVEKVTFVRAADEKIRVFDLRRLGHQPHARPWLGMKPEGLNDPMVLLDQIDAHVANELLPVLDGHRFDLADDAWGRSAYARAAARQAGDAIRRELRTAIGSGQHEAAARVKQLVVASVRHHEAQHGLEQHREPVYPELLAKALGPLHAHGRTNTFALRARNELSAYTSQVASDMWLPQVVVWGLARHAFQERRQHTPEAIAAVLVLEGLARQVGVAVDGSALQGERIDRDRLARLVGPLAAVPTIQLRSAAARLWAELYGEPLVRLVDDVFGE